MKLTYSDTQSAERISFEPHLKDTQQKKGEQDDYKDVHLPEGPEELPSRCKVFDKCCSLQSNCDSK